MAHRLDRKIVEQTFNWLEARPQVLDKLGRVSINLSGNSIGNPDFVAFLLERLRDSRIPCSKVCFEITETAAMRNLNQAIKVLSQLKSLGCVLALDDFGSGSPRSVICRNCRSISSKLMAFLCVIWTK